MNTKRDRQRANREASRIAEAERQSAAKRQRTIVYGVLGAVAAVVVAVVAANVFASDDATTTSDASSDNASSDKAPTSDPDVEWVIPDGCPEPDGSSPRTLNFGEAPPFCMDPNRSHVAVFDTTEGVIRVDLNDVDTPLTVNNFVTLARWHYYDDTTIFRTDTSIDIIQGGAPHNESPADPGPGYNIPDEPTFALDAATGQVRGPYTYRPGQLVMARAGGPNAAGAQFFFTTGDNASNLDNAGTYVVFGTTDDAGLGVLQDIIGLHEPGGDFGGAPSRTVTINSVTIESS